MINLMDDEADSPREKRYQGGYAPVQDPLLPDVEPSSDSRTVGFADDDGIEMRFPNPRERSQSTVSNISEHGKEHGPQQEKPMVMGYNILILLFILGITTSVLNGCAQWANKLISQAQSQVLESNAAGPFLFMLTSAGFVSLSSFIVWKGNIPATIGSGMPEVKATLVNDFHRSDFPSIVSFKILCIRLFSLVSAAGSGLSVGIAAPLVHIAICLSYVLMNKVPDFGEFLENHAIRKQVFAAAAAVGMSTVFNAPIGGLLLSIELTSTFYLISNYWRSFMVATTGAVWYSVFQLARSEEGQIFSVPIVEKPFLQWEFAMFAILGLVCGGLGLNYLKLHQAFFLYVKPYTLKYPISTAASAGALTALLIYAAGAHSAKGVSESVIVHDVFQDCNISEMNSRHNVSPLGGLFASLIVRIFLTLIGTTLRISCGVFLPVLTLGALGGRIFGQILAYMCGNSVNIYVAGYAMVGAVGFVSATTHTISVAVIVIEQTGQFSMLLPCLLAAVIACGITKSRSLSLYDQGMVNKGLESFELLMKEKSGHRYAADVMDEKVISVSEKCTIQDLFSLLGNLRQSTFPVTSGSGRLVGCIERVDIFAFLKSVFEKENLYGYMRDTVSADVHVEDRRLDRLKQIETRNALLQGLNGKSQEYDEDGHPVSHFKGVFGMLGRTSGSLAGIHRVDSEDEMEGFSAEGSAPKEGTHEGPSAINPLHTPPPPPAPVVAPPSPQTDRTVNKTPFKSSKSEDSLLTLDNMVKRFSNRIASFGSVHGDTQGGGVKDALTQLRVDNLLAQSVDLAQEPLLPINGFPFTAHRFTTMDQLYVLFEMVKVQCVFVVTNTKRLEGMISKNLLMQTLKKKRNL